MPSDTGGEVPLTPKEYAKKQRRKAYELAKERRKSDPRYIAMKTAMKEKQRQQRRASYEKIKEHGKVARVARKKAAAEKSSAERAQKDQALMDQLKAATALGTVGINPSSKKPPPPPPADSLPSAEADDGMTNVIPFRRGE